MNSDELAALESDDRPIGICFLCHLPVLGLCGQDQYLDTYMLEPGNSALLEKAFGPCHTRCLLRSQWGSLWASQRVRFKLKAGVRPVADHFPEVTVFRNFEMAHLELIGSDGEMWIFKDSDTFVPLDDGEGSFVDIRDDVSWNFKGFSSKLLSVRHECLHRGMIRLNRLLDALGLWDKLQYPMAIDGALMKCDKSQMEIDDGCWMVGCLNYHLFVPRAVEAVVRHCRSMYAK